MNRVGRFQLFAIQPIILTVTLIAIMTIAGLLTPGFLTFRHLMMILYCNTMLGILALAQTLVILSGGIDLSIGSTYWITVMLGALFMVDGSFILPSIVCIIVGAAIGTINGLGISRLKIPHVVMTLAMMIILTGTLYVTTGGGGRGRAAPELISLSTGRIFGLPIISLVWISLTLLFYIVLRMTAFGWKVRALGSNLSACYCSGISIWKVQVLVYMLSGTLAALAGLLYLGWARTPYPTFQSGAGVGANIMLQSIAAVIIGGTLFSGGRGGVERTFLGVLVLAVLFSILSMAGLGVEWQIMLNGLIILAIVGLHSRIGHR
ncbi:MAG: ABC transporter permease [Desulfobacteraceae bacterium]|nr:ABC transporter permease [Desulfobacteraceae bacterium]